MASSSNATHDDGTKKKTEEIKRIPGIEVLKKIGANGVLGVKVVKIKIADRAGLFNRVFKPIIEELENERGVTFEFLLNTDGSMIPVDADADDFLTCKDGSRIARGRASVGCVLRDCENGRYAGYKKKDLDLDKKHSDIEMVELEGLCNALDWLKDEKKPKPNNLIIMMDNEVVVRRLARKPKLPEGSKRNLYNKCTELLANFKICGIFFVYRELNAVADRIANVQKEIGEEEVIREVEL